ncbi:hypothetical protein K435DRAFT_877153 [Dendrothele bispora CBS 962.96]|uniref:Uncharacterized protein n=1 Tax=Dendrothele bispora (strain CBS 962.96) TaxID=1314807 RepID=A0A4S8KRJ1_DENBC|nr:hypothetical protein K435DRAFT_877153 [Dendrothele bispora CBS 962.96]
MSPRNGPEDNESEDAFIMSSFESLKNANSQQLQVLLKYTTQNPRTSYARRFTRDEAFRILNRSKQGTSLSMTKLQLLESVIGLRKTQAENHLSSTLEQQIDTRNLVSEAGRSRQLSKPRITLNMLLKTSQFRNPESVIEMLVSDLALYQMNGILTEGSLLAQISAYLYEFKKTSEKRKAPPLDNRMPKKRRIAMPRKVFEFPSPPPPRRVLPFPFRISKSARRRSNWERITRLTPTPIDNPSRNEEEALSPQSDDTTTLIRRFMLIQ